MRGSPAQGSTRGLPVRETTPNHRYTADEEGVSFHKRWGSQRSRGNWSGSDSDDTLTSGGRQKKKDGFSSKIQIPEFRDKKGHPHDVAEAFRQWAHCITYYHDYYEDSHLMSLVVSSLMGDTLDVFDWTCSVSPGGAQDFAKSAFSDLKLCEVLLSLNYAWTLVFQLMSCTMLGECCEMVRKFFVRVLHSSRVILTM